MLAPATSQSLSRPACVPASLRASFGTQADHRWLLSGTPVQNRPEELFSYLSFLQYAPYPNSLAAFHTLMREPRVLAAGASAVERLRTVLRPIILRRTQADRHRRQAHPGPATLVLPCWLCTLVVLCSYTC